MLNKSFNASREALPVIRKWLRDALNSVVQPDKLDHSLVLIGVGEVLQNIVRYGFEANSLTGSVSVSLYQMPYGVGLEIEDTAPPSDPSLWVSDKDASEGGLGLVAIESAASAVTYTPLRLGNRCRLVFLYDNLHLSNETVAWIGDIFLARQRCCDLSEHCCAAMGKFLEHWHRDLFQDCEIEVLAHIDEHRSKLFYHNEWHIQDVIISLGHLLRTTKDQFGAVDRLDAVLAALFHDHLHPGAYALRDMNVPIENVSAGSTSEFLLGLETPLSSQNVNRISDIIRSTEPSNRLRLRQKLQSSSSNSTETLLQALVNDADILASMIPSLGESLARAMKYEALITDLDSAGLYENFRLGVEVLTKEGLQLVERLPGKL